MDELWKPIASCGGYYSISNKGRVMVTGTRKWGHKPGKIIKPFDNNGYVRYNLYPGGRTILRKLAHVLVYEAFIGPIPFGLEPNHINGDRADNRPENLKAVTPSQNVRHSFDVLGKKPSAHRANLSWEQAEEIRADYAKGDTSYSKLAKKYGIDHSNVGRIVKYKLYNDPTLKNRPSSA